MIELNYKDTRPIYEQIKDCIKKLIISGALSENEKLQSVRALAIQLSINPNTIQRAYNELEAEGYVYSQPGKGSFVAPGVKKDEKAILEMKKKFIEIAKELKYLGVTYEEMVDLLRGED